MVGERASHWKAAGGIGPAFPAGAGPAERLRSLLGRLSAGERKDALRGLGLLARAASEEMHARHAAASARSRS